MPSFVSHPLTDGQKVRLALSVLIIYWPIRLYQNIPGWDSDLVTNKLPFFVVEGLLTFGFMLGWVYLIDALYQRLVSQFGNAGTGELRLPAQLLLLVAAVVMALTFNAGFGYVHRRMDTGLTQQFPGLGQSPERHPHAEKNDFNLRKRMNNGLLFMALLSAFYLTTNRRSIRRIE